MHLDDAPAVMLCLFFVSAVVGDVTVLPVNLLYSELLRMCILRVLGDDVGEFAIFGVIRSRSRN